MSVHMRIRCEVEVEVGVWGDTTSFAEIRNQASREGAHKLASLISQDRTARIIGEPTVVAIIAVDEVDVRKGGA